MNTRELPLRLQVLINLSRALWEVPTPELRFIALEIEDRRVNGRFGYDKPIDDEIFDLVSSAAGYLDADFPASDDVHVHFTAEHVPRTEPRTLRDGEEWYYLRYEPPVDR